MGLNFNFLGLNLAMAAAGAVLPLVFSALLYRKSRRLGTPLLVLAVMALAITAGFLLREVITDTALRLPLGYAHVPAVLAWVIEIVASIILLCCLWRERP